MKDRNSRFNPPRASSVPEQAKNRAIEWEVARFGIFELDLRRQELRRKGFKVPLQKQPFEILRLLVTHRGDFVSRDLIQQTLWPEGRFVDFERSINTAITRLRHALRESASSPAYIETVTRVGYRLLVPVTSPVPDAAEPAPRSIGSIAILPLQDLSPSSDGQFFVDGLTDALITEMARTSRLRVVSRMTTAKYRDSRLSMREIATELNVEAIVEGSMLRSDTRIRISVRLLDAVEDRHLWAQTYDRDLTDILRLQQELAAAIGTSASRTLAGDSGTATERELRPQAYESYLKGNYLLSLRSPNSLPRAIECYRGALSLEPQWGPPYSGLCEARRLIEFAQHRHSEAAVAEMIGHARQAIELQPDHALGHATLGAVLALHQWRWQEGEQHIRHALQLDPSASHVEFLCSFVLVARRRFEEASRHIDAALAIDHSSRFLRSHRIQILLFSGQFEQAAWESEDILNDQPEFTMGLINYGAALLGLERPAEALGRFERAFAGSSHPMSLIGVAHSHHLLGDSLDAAATVARVQQLYDAGGCSRCVVGLAHAAIGELETAIDAMEKAITERDIRLPIYTQAQPADLLRADPRFMRILDRIYGSA